MADERLVLGYANDPGRRLAIENAANAGHSAVEIRARAGGITLAARGGVFLQSQEFIDAGGGPIRAVADPAGDDHVVNRRYLERHSDPPLGVLAGGALAAGGAPSAIRAAAGAGSLEGEYVAWEGQEVALPADDGRFHIFVEAGGAAVARPEPPEPSDLRARLYLGGCLVANGAVVSVVGCPAVARAPAAQLHDLAAAVGPVHAGGDVLAGVRGSLAFTKTAGHSFALGGGFAAAGGGAAPHRVETPVFGAGDVFRYCRRDGAPGPLVAELDPDEREDTAAGDSSDGSKGSKKSSSKAAWTFQPIFVTFAGEVFVQQGQAYYSSSRKAVEGARGPFAVAPFLAEFAVAVGFVALKRGAKDAGSKSDAVFGQYGRFGMG